MRHLPILVALLSTAALACSAAGSDETQSGGYRLPKNAAKSADGGASAGAASTPPSPAPTGSSQPPPAPSASAAPSSSPPSSQKTDPTPSDPTPPPWDGSAPKGSTPVSGGSLIVLGDGITAVAADPDRDMVSIVDLAAATVRAQIQLPAGSEPGRLVEDAAGRVHVVLRRGGGIADIDLFGGVLLGLRRTCALPRGIAFRAADGVLLVSCLTGELQSLSADPTVKDVATVTLTSNGVVVDDLRDVLLRGDGVYVTRFRSAELVKVQDDGTVVGRVTPSTRADTSAARLAAAGLSGGTPQNYVPSVAWRAVVGPSGDVVMVHEGGTDRVIDVSNANGGGTQMTSTTTCTSSDYGGTVCTTTDGPPICAPPIVVALVTSISQTGVVSDGPALPNGALPVDLAVTPDGKSYVVVLAGNRGESIGPNGAPFLNVLTVPAVDPSAGPDASAATFDGDLCGLAFTQSGFIVPGRPTAVALDGQGRPVVLTREPAAIQHLTPGGLQAIPLSAKSVADVGFDLFHDDTGRGMACASCHAEGQDDARAWKFTPGLDANGNPLAVLVRRTQTFRQGFLDTAPFHWDGEFAGIPALMNDVFVHRMAAGVAPSPDEEAALEQWMNRIPPKMHDPPSPEEAQSIARGKALFEDPKVGCTECHVGPQLTNNQSKDIGFGVATQVPSLVDVRFRAPFLHDGSVATLEDRFGDATAKSGKHGNTQVLFLSQVADLVAYLKSL